MRALVAVVTLVLALSACGGSEVAKPPDRLVAERLVLLADGSIALAGIGASGTDEDSGCRPGENPWDFFVARVSPRGRLLRTDVVTETTLDACGDLVIDARRRPAGRVDVIGWTVAPHTGRRTAPSISHSRQTASRATASRPPSDSGTTAPPPSRRPPSPEAAAPGCGLLTTASRCSSRSSVPAGRSYALEPRALPANAQFYDNWLYWYSLSADQRGRLRLRPVHARSGCALLLPDLPPPSGRKPRPALRPHRRRPRPPAGRALLRHDAGRRRQRRSRPRGRRRRRRAVAGSRT